MGAKYIYRVDDLNARMNWQNFWKLMGLFSTQGVKPLLGVVPDNKDPDLIVEQVNNDYWEILNHLERDGLVEIAQHGYQHSLFSSRAKPILGKGAGFTSQTEFAGLSYKLQLEKIKSGKAILEDKGIFTDIWMAPNHSFDWITLKALRASGFRAITDGIALYPFSLRGLTFIPQQFWRPRFFPLGIITICLHVNSMDEKIYQRVKAHLESKAKIISFNEARKQLRGRFAGFLDRTFQLGYFLIRKTKQLVKALSLKLFPMKEQL